MKQTTYLLTTIVVSLFILVGCNDPAIEELSIAGPNDTIVNPLDTIPEAEIISQLVIEEIEILSIISKDDNGNYWDGDHITEGPDMFLHIETLDETISVLTEVLCRSDACENYSWDGSHLGCSPELNDAVFRAGELPFLFPINKIIEITLLDQDIFTPWGGYFVIDRKMYSFIVNIMDYRDSLQPKIYIYSDGDCRYVLALKVKWI